MKPEPMHNLNKPFPGGGNNNCPCFAWKVMLRRLRKLRAELVATRRELRRLQAIVDGR